MPELELQGRVVVVTGADGLLGAQVVATFKQQGARVARIVRRDPGNVHDTYRCDVTDEASVSRCFSEISGDLGNIYALIHTVGMWGMSPLKEITLSDWQLMMAVNLDSAFLCFREALRHMTNGGRLVAVASRQGADGGVAEQAVYSASKGGVVRLVESTAAEYTSACITANAVAPYQISSGPDSPGASPADIANACLYLCTNRAAAITGTVLRMYGSS